MVIDLTPFEKQITDLPAWLKAWLAGGTLAGLAFAPQIVLLATPYAVKAVDTAVELFLKIPPVRWWIGRPGNRAAIKANLRALTDAVKTLIDGINAAVDQDLEAIPDEAPLATVPQLNPPPAGALPPDNSLPPAGGAQ